ncbi:uncharacterized protein [Spinacia oleracea]|uniref:RNase H type-1 domain-containing protein n=1 Tax=Spinacia oleracea TaxID=3562 RepID=A0ABM3R8U6_SPIOL|nr:uncharacterized protein LOC130467519 [Spinacia oleracea]
MGGMGMVVRDSVEDVVMSAGNNVKIPATTHTTEAIAALFGLQYAYVIGFRNIIMETDCLALVNILLEKTKDNIEAHMNVNDALLLSRKFDACCFNFAKCSCNKMAHSFAKASLDFEEVIMDVSLPSSLSWNTCDRHASFLGVDTCLSNYK